jgi:PAS domain S-box-containing protein
MFNCGFSFLSAALMKRKIILFLWLFAAILMIAPIARAGRLPVRAYTTADGLANDGVNRIVRDSRGFLWFSTGEGLSRFDGFGFKNYTQNEGLPHRSVNDFLETGGGDLLVATTGGLAVFNPNGRVYRWNILKSNLEQTSSEPPLFRTFLPPNLNDERAARTVLSLAEDRAGNVYAGTRRGLFHIEKNGDEWNFKKIESGEWTEKTEFSVLKFDAAGYLWLVTSTGIYRRSPAGAVKNFHEDGGGSILIDNNNQIWVGSSGTPVGLRVFTVTTDGTEARLTKTYHISDGLPAESPIADIIQTSTNQIFLLVAKHLCEFLPQAPEGESKFRIIEDGAFQALAEDAGGNLWLGTNQEGAWKLALSGFTRYDERDGLPAGDISSLGINRTGNVFITGGKNISRLADGKFETIAPLGLMNRSWGSKLLDFQAGDGEWWIPSVKGLLRYPKIENFADLAKTPPKKIYTTADGLYGNEVFNLFEDSRGDVWISTIYTPNSVHLWERKTGVIRRFSTDDGLPNLNNAVAFSEDANGSVWIGFYEGGVARYRNDKFDVYTGKDGVPESTVNAITSDKAGRLWIATASRGVLRVDNPNADTPNFLSLSTAGGLSSNQTNCLAEDDFGRIYIGTGRGIDRIEPTSGLIKSFTQADGLPGSVVSFCRRDRNGALWFVSRNSLVKLVPQTETALKPPPVFISGINVNGIARPVSELGAARIENLNLNADERQIRIDFFALDFNAGDRLRYQYKLGGEDWHEPEDTKSFNFDLAPGDYQFFVRAVNADNVASSEPATVSFKIAAPVWRRWWFLTLVALLLALTIFGLDRFRVRKTRQVENALEISRESAARFRTLAQTASDAIITVNKDSRIVFVNDAVETVFGYTEKELIGAELTTLMPDAFRQAHHTGMNNYLATNVKRISWAAIELPGKHKSGKYHTAKSRRNTTCPPTARGNSQHDSE